MRAVIKVIFICLCTSLSADTASLNNFNQDEGKITFDIDVEKKTYSYRLETPDGTVKHEEGHFETDPSTGEESLVAVGGYGYISDDGQQYTVTYTADKNGYRPYVSFGTRLGGVGFGGAAGVPAAGRPGGAGGGFGGGGGAPSKGIDPALLCSLAGSGCK